MGLESWVMFPCIGRTMGRSFHRVADILRGRQPHREKVGMWVYTPLVEAMSEAVMQGVENYINRRHNTVAQYILTGPIIDLFLVA